MQAASDERCNVLDVMHTLADAWSGPGFAVTVAPTVAPLWVACPARTLDTALSVLLDNARQAGASAATLTLVPSADGLVELRCNDNGPGIAAGDRDRVFEPFFTGRREQGGTGLGLSIARTLVEASGGRVGLLSTDAGACFALTLRRA
jgi:signal transduction histidine kinase